MLRVIAIRDDDADQAPVLVFEDSSQTWRPRSWQTASPPALSFCRCPMLLDSWAVKREKSALCGYFSSNLRYFVGNLRARRVKMSVTSTVGVTSTGRRTLLVVVPTPRLLSKKTPHPTRERRAGQRTDPAFPNAREDDERGGVLNA
jgi:hypothetical protein